MSMVMNLLALAALATLIWLSLRAGRDENEEGHDHED